MSGFSFSKKVVFTLVIGFAGTFVASSSFASNFSERDAKYIKGCFDQLGKADQVKCHVHGPTASGEQASFEKQFSKSQVLSQSKVSLEKSNGNFFYMSVKMPRNLLNPFEYFNSPNFRFYCKELADGGYEITHSSYRFGFHLENGQDSLFADCRAD